MITLTETQIATWLASVFWPFVRIAAMVSTAPVFNSRQYSTRIKIVMVFLVTLVVVPTLPASPVVDVFSHEALLILLQQMGIGVVMGFTLQLVFGALVFGGQAMAYSMGLGFAHMIDPQNGVQVPVLAQFYVILAILIMLVLDIHLTLIDMVVSSFHALPVAVDGITRNTFWELASWASRMFQSGLLMALPVVGSLLLVNIGMGVMARAAPQMNIFAIGFPITLLMGLFLVFYTLPAVMNNFVLLMDEAMQFIRDVVFAVQ